MQSVVARDGIVVVADWLCWALEVSEDIKEDTKEDGMEVSGTIRARAVLCRSTVIVTEGEDLLVPRFGCRLLRTGVHLSFYEALYLVTHKQLSVYAACDGIADTARDAVGEEKLVDEVSLRLVCKKNHERFDLNYAVYEALVGQGWILRNGINYGVEFLLYDQSPDVAHSRYCFTLHFRYAVAVYGERDVLPTSRLFAMNRVCLSANKTLVVALVLPPDDTVIRYIKVRRWDPKTAWKADSLLEPLAKLL